MYKPIPHIKTKDLSPLDYIEKLQLEYICAELRKNIYHNIKDKNYYKKVMNGKKEKIEFVSQKNSIQTIFTSNEIKQQLYLKIIPEKGLPNFIYKDESKKLLDIQDGDNLYPNPLNQLNEEEVIKLTQYKNENEILKQNDIVNYYKKGIDVKVHKPNSNEVLFFGKIMSINLKAKIVEVVKRNDSNVFGVYDMSNVTRIF